MYSNEVRKSSFWLEKEKTILYFFAVKCSEHHVSSTNNGTAERLLWFDFQLQEIVKIDSIKDKYLQQTEQNRNETKQIPFAEGGIHCSIHLFAVSADLYMLLSSFKWWRRELARLLALLLSIFLATFS